MNHLSLTGMSIIFNKYILFNQHDITETCVATVFKIKCSQRSHNARSSLGFKWITLHNTDIFNVYGMVSMIVQIIYV